MKNVCLVLLILCSFRAHTQWDSLYSFTNPTYALHKQNNAIYLGLGGGGVYKSEDSGITWTPKNNGIQFGGAYIYSLASSNDTLYAGGFGEVCRTVDGGENWTLLNLNLDLNAYVYDLVAHDNFIFAAVGHHTPSNGVYRKLLNGVVWNEMSNGLPDGEWVNALESYGDFLFAGTDAGLYRSSDGGASWTISGSGIEFGLDINEIATVNGQLLVGTDNGVYITSDNGDSWFHSIGMPENSIVVSLAGNDTFIVAGTYTTAYFSEDQGYSWSILNFGLPEILSMYSLCSDDNFIYGGSGGIVWRYSFISLFGDDQSDSLPNQLNVYPNPSSAHTTCVLSENLIDAHLTLFSSDGRMVFEKQHVYGARIELDLSNLSGGFHYLVIADENCIFQKPILIISQTN